MDNKHPNGMVKGGGYDPVAYPPPPPYSHVNNAPMMAAPGHYQGQNSGPQVYQNQPYQGQMVGVHTYQNQPYHGQSPALQGYLSQPHQGPGPYQGQRPVSPGYQTQPYQGPGSGTQAYPPQPYHTQATFRTMHVYSEGWSGRHIRVCDEDKTTVLYNVETHMRKPNIIVKIPSSNTTLGTAGFHTFSSRIDISLHDTSNTLTSRGVWKNGYTFPCQALGGETFTWKSLSNGSDLVCLDQAEQRIARFEFSGWSMKKYGRLELLGPKAQGGPAMEEVVLTCLAYAYHVVMTKASTNSASASGAAAGAAAC